MPKIYISPERRPAPHGKYWGENVYETDYCYDIADRLKPLLEANGFEVVIAPKELDIKQRSLWANANGFNYYLPIHTNASTNGTAEGTASGTEMLCHPSALSRKACQFIYDELTALHPSNRGVKDGGAYTENNMTKMVSAYCEISFHDNGNDVAFLLQNKQEIAVAIAKGVCKYFDIAYAPAEPEETGHIVTLAELADILRKTNVIGIRI